MIAAWPSGFSRASDSKRAPTTTLGWATEFYFREYGADRAFRFAKEVQLPRKRVSNAKNSFLPPPSQHAAMHARILARLKAMSPEEFKSSLVRSGIATPAGKLTAEYRQPRGRRTPTAKRR